MNPLIQYIITLFIVFIIATLLIKLLVIPIFDFYEHVNFMVWLFIIGFFAVFFMPKAIFIGYEMPSQSCECLGFKNIQQEGYLKEVKCSGFIYSCIGISTFKSKASNSEELCNLRYKDFFKSKDECFQSVAQQVIQESPNNKDKANNLCGKITNLNAQNDCFSFVKEIINGNPVF